MPIRPNRNSESEARVGIFLDKERALVLQGLVVERPDMHSEAGSFPAFRVLEQTSGELPSTFAPSSTHRNQRVTTQFRAEATKVFNHINPDLPNNVLGTGTFGQVTSVREPRILQLAMKLYF